MLVQLYLKQSLTRIGVETQQEGEKSELAYNSDILECRHYAARTCSQGKYIRAPQTVMQVISILG